VSIVYSKFNKNDQIYLGVSTVVYVIILKSLHGYRMLSGIPRPQSGIGFSTLDSPIYLPITVTVTVNDSQILYS